MSKEEDVESRFSPRAVLARLEPFTKASTPRALLSLAQTLLLFLGGWVLAYFTVSWSWLGFAASTFLLFACKMRLFVLYHDMGSVFYLSSPPSFCFDKEDRRKRKATRRTGQNGKQQGGQETERQGGQETDRKGGWTGEKGKRRWTGEKGKRRRERRKEREGEQEE